MLLAFMTTGWFDAEQKIRLNQGEATQVLGLHHDPSRAWRSRPP
jgi:hypothetical protein